MKKIFYATLVTVCTLLSLAVVSCSKSDDNADTLNVSVNELSFTAASRSATVTVSSNLDWSGTAPEWIALSPNTGTGNTSVTVTAEQNEGIERSGTIRFTAGEMVKTIEVTQEGVDFNISQYAFEFDSDCTPIEATISSKYDWEIIIPEKASWLGVSPQKGTSGETKVTFTPKPFTDRTPRTKQLLTVNYGNTFAMLTVSQAMPNTNPEAPELLSPDDNATDVKVNATFQWRAATDPDGDELTYKLMVSGNNGSTWTTATTSETSVKLTNLLEKQTAYIWKVEASDPFGGKTESVTRSFTTGKGGAYADGEITRWQTETAGAPMPVQLVIMGDGYIADDYVAGGTFDQHVETAIEAFFGVEPFTTYRNYFRVSTVAVYSQERGATVLKDMTGCKAQTRNTAFSATLEGGNSTGTSCNYDKVFSYALKVPGVTDEVLRNTTVLLLINLDVYAGTCLMESTGRSVSMCPAGPTFEAVVSHEGGGHGFGRLLDEYRYYNTSLPESEKSQINQWRALDPYYGYNISLTNDRSQVHWNQYFSMAGYEAVSLYEGACLYGIGVWRPEYISCMEDNRAYYNAPSREAIVRRICRASGTTFSMNSFVANDKVKSDNTRATRAPEYFVPLAPPILIDK